MQISEIIQRGIEAKLISIDSEFKNVAYRAQNKKYRLSDPEEIVRAGAYVSLVLDYGYPAEQLDVEFPVPHRVPSLTADIVVFKDEARKSPFIVVETKREEASKGELDQAVEQGFGYANSLSAEFLWMTSGIRNDYFQVAGFGGMERVENRQPDIPRFGKTESAAYKYTKGGIDGFELEIVQENELTRKFKQAHDALWAGGKRNPAEGAPFSRCNGRRRLLQEEQHAALEALARLRREQPLRDRDFRRHRPHRKDEYDHPR
ncbi:MAG: type I restriction enzyme HsdR N-terminal domain-containing protein [Sphingobium sp.]